MRAGSWIPWTYVGGMLVVFAANGALVWFALSTWSGLAVDNAYRRGLSYNRVIGEAERQDALGWTARTVFEPDPADSRRGRIAVDLSDATGAPISDLALSARLVRPLERLPEIEPGLRYVGAGRYQAEVELPRRGQWELRVVAAGRGETFRFARRFQTP